MFEKLITFLFILIITLYTKYVYLESLVSKCNWLEECFNFKYFEIFNLLMEKILKFFFVQLF